MLGAVLCGHGKRLRPLTNEITKFLIEIKEGKQIIVQEMR